MGRPGGHRDLRVGTSDRVERVTWAGAGVHTCVSSAQGPVGTGGGELGGGTGPTPCTNQFSLIPSCVCKEGQVGDGRACYGHLLHEVQKATPIRAVFLGLRAALSMLGV